MKYAIIGTGNISNTYARAIAEMPGSEISACVSRSGNRPKAGPDIPVLPDLDSITTDFDAVIVATPNGLHCEGIIAAAKRGKHVITEKPLGIRVDEMEQAIAACEAANVTLAVAYQRRTAPDNRAVKALIEKGALGNIFAADLAAKFYRDQAYYDSADYRGGLSIDGGGPFMQQAAHNIDIYAWFFGLPEQVVSLMGTFTHKMEAEDHGAALLKYSNGMIGTIIASTSTKPGYAARLEVHSDKGSFTMTDDAITQWHFDGVPNPGNSDFQYQHDGATSAVVSDTGAHQKIIADFERVVEQGGTPIADGHSAKATSTLILEIYGSALT
ncbi:MAG: Gfo/Idh/MocA family oxidoreductase [Saprospiraceae bacterium]|nr:Gfo/Idh/MocA family oxidoreductase [Saprospiraceae bacterium]